MSNNFIHMLIQNFDFKYHYMFRANFHDNSRTKLLLCLRVERQKKTQEGNPRRGDIYLGIGSPRRIRQFQDSKIRIGKPSFEGKLEDLEKTLEKSVNGSTNLNMSLERQRSRNDRLGFKY